MVVVETGQTKTLSLLDEVTVLILTYNEGPNIRRTLEKLLWARRIIVVDSFSTDETLEIIRTHKRIEVIQRRFDNHMSQWNYGLDQVDTDWVLCLDADYQLTGSFISELQGLRLDEPVDAYYVRFKYCIDGRALRGALYPPRAVCFCRCRCRYEQDG